MAKNGREAANLACSEDFDLLILDLGLPGKDGLVVLKELRGQGESLPVIVLTARDGVEDTVAGLEGGADDYVTKPFRFEELLARIRVRLRTHQSPKGQGETVLRVGTVALDLKTRQVWVGDRLVALSARECFLTEVFLRHPMHVLSKEQLLNHVWGYDYAPDSNIVNVYIGHLRKKLGSDRIETVKGMGFRFRP